MIEFDRLLESNLGNDRSSLTWSVTGLDRVWYRTMGVDRLRGVLRGGLLGWIVFGIKQGVWRVTVFGVDSASDGGQSDLIKCVWISSSCRLGHSAIGSGYW